MNKLALPVLAVVVIFTAGLILRVRQARRLDNAANFKTASRTDYFEFGLSLRELGVLGWDGQACAFRGVIYPAILSAVETYRPDRRPRMPLVQAVMGALSAPLCAAAALEMFSPASALAAAALAAFHPEMSRSIPGCKIETIYTFLLGLVAWSLARWGRRSSWGETLLLGLALGVSLMCRAVLFAFPVILALAASLRWVAYPGGRKLWTLLGVSYLVLLPWIARNALQFGRFIPFEDHAATRNLYAASSGFIENEEGPFQDILASQADAQGALEDPLKHMWSLAWRNIASNPIAYTVSTVGRLSFVLGLHPWLFLLAAAGFWARRRDPGVRLLALLAGYFVLVHVPMSLEPRYIEPILPVLMVLAVGLWPGIADAVPRLSRAGAAVTAAILLSLYGLGVQRLAAEILLSRVPCALPQTPSAAYHCGERLRVEGDRAGAAARWSKGLELLDKTPGEGTFLRAKLQIALLAAGQIPLAAGCSRLARDLPEEVNTAAIRLRDEGRAEEALRLHDAVLSCHPRDARFLSDRAVALVLAGHREPARKDLQSALAAEPGDARASYNLGMLLEGEGRRSEALTVYENAARAAREAKTPVAETPFKFVSLIASRIKELRNIP